MACLLIILIVILVGVVIYLADKLYKCYKGEGYKQTLVGPSFLVDPTIPGNPGVNWKQVKRRVFFNF